MAIDPDKLLAIRIPEVRQRYGWRECALYGLGIGFGEATPDGRVRLEPVYCLGLCSVAPSAMLDGRIVGRLDDRKLEALLAEVER